MPIYFSPVIFHRCTASNQWFFHILTYHEVMLSFLVVSKNLAEFYNIHFHRNSLSDPRSHYRQADSSPSHAYHPSQQCELTASSGSTGMVGYTVLRATEVYQCIQVKKIQGCSTHTENRMHQSHVDTSEDTLPL